MKFKQQRGKKVKRAKISYIVVCNSELDQAVILTPAAFSFTFQFLEPERGEKDKYFKPKLSKKQEKNQAF